MSDEDLSKQTSVRLPLGHLLIVWSVLSDKLAGPPFNDQFTAEERRAIWGLQDLCEKVLIKNGITSKPAKEWDQLIVKATEFVKTIPVEFLD